jgi:hypothetical protein
MRLTIDGATKKYMITTTMPIQILCIKQTIVPVIKKVKFNQKRAMLNLSLFQEGVFSNFESVIHT